MPDSNVMINSLAEWHDDHQVARAEIEGRLRAGEAMVLAGHATLETFSVLTRMPARHRAEPAAAFEAPAGRVSFIRISKLPLPASSRFPPSLETRAGRTARPVQSVRSERMPGQPARQAATAGPIFIRAEASPRTAARPGRRSPLATAPARSCSASRRQQHDI